MLIAFALCRHRFMDLRLALGLGPLQTLRVQ